MIYVVYVWFVLGFKGFVKGECVIVDWDEDLVMMVVEVVCDILIGMDWEMVGIVSLLFMILLFVDCFNVGLVKEVFNLFDVIYVFDCIGS